jgi:argininosuccinate lyase
LLSLPSGDKRDQQISKGGIFHGVHRGLMAMELMPDLLARMRWNEAAMRAAIEPAMYATDVAIEQAAKGVPFRDAYRAAAQAAGAAGQGRTPEQSLAARTSPGAHADLRLHALQMRLNALDA